MVEGRCLCGAVRFVIDGDLPETRLCYCENCRRANGTVFSANIRVLRERYTLVSGGEAVREYESSPGVFRAFCTKCGSPVHARVEREPEAIRIRLGALPGNVGVTISAHVWTRSKPVWYEIVDELPVYEEAFDSALIEKS